MSKKLVFNANKPQRYYFRLFLFVIVVAFLGTLTIHRFEVDNYLIFFLRFIIIVFLLFSLSAFIEYLQVGEFMGFLEVSTIETFYKDFYDTVRYHPDNIYKFFNKYDVETKNKFKNIFSKRSSFFLSSIRKDGDVYIISIIQEQRLFLYFLFKFLGRKGVHKLYVKDLNGKGKYRIINIK